jgi:hypothetical protein
MMERLLRRWEGLSTPVQTIVAVVASVTFMFLLHLGPFRQPLGRALGYAAFWGVLMAGGIMVATRAEQAKRRAADEQRKKR